jgi:thiol-disulfide isomerase/thioredoxin
MRLVDGVWRKTLLTAFAFFTAGQAQAIVIKDKWPAVAVRSVVGGPAFEQATAQGKVTVVNFWATWCEACKIELKEMEAEFKQFEANQNVQLAFVSMDKNPAEAKEWFDRYIGSEKFKAALFEDSQFKAAEAIEVDSFPLTLVIDQTGVVQLVQRGFKEGEGSTAKIAEEVKTLLAKPGI